MEIFTTMITPYKKDGSVDYDTVRKYVDWFYASGIDGIFAICQSSEIFYLSLDERIKINHVVYERAKELERKGKRKFTVISSGHVSDDIREQINELNAVWQSGTDALILITNRLDPDNQGDDVFLNNAEYLLSKLPDNIKLGLYECPYPYKRLVTPRILDWCLSTGRFYYLKDTCCDVAEISRRSRQLKDSHFSLLNANCQTFLETIQNGADGYCGIMCNFHPKLYAWLGKHYQTQPKTAELVQSIIGTFGFTEVGLPYPLTAKYSMSLCGIKTENIARNRNAEELTDYGRSCIKQMKAATDYIEKMLQI